MNVKVTQLWYWKSDHDQQSCQDAVNYNHALGLFAVADGVGSSSFSEIWSRVLVDQFVAVPLLGPDPFEVEWWLQRAQTEFAARVPQFDNLPPIAREKAQQGSQSTLVALRVVEITDDQLHAQMLAFGDSCIFIHHASGSMEAFPIQECPDFDRPPVCLPTRPQEYDYDFHRCKMTMVTLMPGDKIILATDAVAHWLWCSDEASTQRRDANFRTLAAFTTQEQWSEFTQASRSQHLIRDDDATALILQFTGEGEGDPLGYYLHLPADVVAARAEELAAAYSGQFNELIAIKYGDGQALSSQFKIEPTEIEHAQQVARAIKKISQSYKRALRLGQDIRMIVEPLWQQYNSLLWDEPSAKNLRASLEQVGLTPNRSLHPDETNLEHLRVMSGADGHTSILES